MENRKLKFKLWLYFSLAIACLGVVAIFYPWNGLNGLPVFKKWYLETDNYSTLGNFVYGISVPFLSFSTVLLLWRTYTLQNLQLEEQRESIRKQRFEETFFQLLETHNHIVEAIDLSRTETGNASFDSKLMKIKRDIKTIEYEKRDCFKLLNKDLKEYCKEYNLESLKEVLEIYNMIQQANMGDLHHYYRFIYRVLKFIKEAKNIDEDMKYNYAGIFRALFSPYELAMIFYNGLHEYGYEKLKPLLEEFSFFKNIDNRTLVSVAHKDDYYNVAFGDYKGKTRLENLADWKVIQDKKK